jgi:lipopolysaccharide transport system permease protein
MPETLRANYYSVELTGHRLRFELENASDSSWEASEAIVTAYQIFDSATGALLVDGERMPLPAEFPPGARAPFDLELAIPEESGSYRIYASPMREHRAWAYESGLPFILANVRVSAARELLVEKLAVTDLPGIARRNLWRAVPRAFIQPFRTVWRNRRLSATLVKRDILSRSRGSFGGGLWTILNPLLLMLTYFFVFGLVLQARFDNDPSPASFALYFLAGMLPWLAFSEAAGRAPTVLLEYRQLIKKLVFPVEILPVNLVLSGLVGEAFGVVLFALGFLLIRHHLPWTIVYLPVLLVPQLLFTAGVAWFMSAFGVFFRDLAQVNGFLMTLWFFITPICYPESKVPSGARAFLTKNPIFILVRGYRAIFLESRAPDWRSLAELTIASLLLAVLGHAWFYKLRRSFVDVL